ncbi:UDP-N-acetylmuramoyl-tripeptide--D-alanyl-D-alanine ligase [Nitrosophilus kaiyonis]|uniref:UDP-N-acetylmuramoyl-tripeptide--D-alanyl-D- alanine ligase n=1 Tax=Nitrosophilus kaiyonis TaxID=2930200 RepID=UPI0024923482|nr:UDP-N-acetylmuramoyl-tripeptide--D-alanyl-D-alanine ligase [Nitrosophilus kaiyonis]
MVKIFHFIEHIIFILSLGYYFILNLQWYNYKIDRVLLHHHRPSQHIYLFLLPFFLYIAFRELFLPFLLIYILYLYFWQKKLDKKLVFTARVKRFFLILVFFAFFIDILCIAKFNCKIFPTLLPLILAFIVSNLIEKFLFTAYKSEAAKKLKEIDPSIIGVTASYGKTSIKNFLFQILSQKYNTYATPRSVNTLGGIIKDINQDLPKNTQIYIVEAGARERGDIYEIASFLNPQYVVIGKLGPQHIEYFKTMENIIATKLELLSSNRLKKAFLYDEIPVKDKENFVKFGKNINNLKSSLDGISFDLEIDNKLYHFEAPVLGAFNAINITAAIMVALEFGFSIENLQKIVKNLKSVEHRLQKIESNGKIIIDDSFNGNFEGMISSYELVKNYPKRKVIVTPGIVESTKEANEKLARKIDEVFDLVIITGKINREILDKNINRAKKIVLEDKSKLQEVLAQNTKPGDLILFSNDTPAYL